MGVVGEDGVKVRGGEVMWEEVGVWVERREVE